MTDAWPPCAFTPESAWGRCLVAFLRASYERSGSTNTITHYRACLYRFFSSPAKLPQSYTREDVERFLYTPGTAPGRVGVPIAPATANHRLAVLGAFYRFAGGYTVEIDGVIAPLLHTSSPTLGFRYAQTPRSYRSISYANFEKFFAAIPTDSEIGLRDRALFLTYFWTIRRRAEVLALRWGDIEEAMLIDADGSRRRGWLYHFRGKGSGRHDDAAELPGRAKTAIDRYLVASGRRETMQPESPVFISITSYKGKDGHDPMRPLGGSTVWGSVKKYARLAGIDPKSLTIHSFRHAGSQFRYRNGQQLLSISHTLRHRSLDTTRIYLEGLVTATDDGAALLEQQFGKFSDG
jgi:site-specific recombinase XerD